jgi:hypothetical protein
MPCRYGTDPAQRLRTEFVEADIEVGFHLVDMARLETLGGHAGSAARMTREAEAVMRDARERLDRLGPSDQFAFEPLVGELKRAIELANREREGTDGAPSDD